MLFRHAAKRPKRVLQAFGERHKTLAAEHDTSVLPARKGEPEMIETMRQRRAGDDDCEPAHVGEIG